MLSISDTRFLDGEKRSNKAEFYQDFDLDAFSDNVMLPENTPLPTEVIQEKPPQVVPQEPEKQGADYIADWTKQNAEILQKNKPVYNIDREKQLQRVGRLQKFTDALTVLGQVVGAKAGASVPQMQLNNSNEASGIVMKMRDAYEDDLKRHQLIGMQQQLKSGDLLLNQQISDNNYKRSKQDADTVRAENNQREDKRWGYQVEKDQKIDERYEAERKQREAEQKTRNSQWGAEFSERKRVNDASIASRNAYSAWQNIRTNTKEKPTTSYLDLYTSAGSLKPSAYIENEGQAIAVFNAIINNPNIIDPSLDIFRDPDFPQQPKSDDYKRVVAKHWQSVMPAPDEDGSTQGQQQESDYVLPDYFNKTRLEEFDTFANDIFNTFKAPDKQHLIYKNLYLRLITPTDRNGAGLTEQEAKDFINKHYGNTAK